jgi:hypothetical protein
MNDQTTGARGHMPFPGHRSQAEVAEPGRPPVVLAHFRPAEREVLIIVAGGNPAGIALTVEEARSIHTALGQALKLADSVGEPMEAVR